ncbi:TPA: hypothetical protein DIU27_05685 [Candidatus Collierbacteria bacterium]|nr:hypothetical protein [Candidatus Collierbacteria bacterium]
MKFALSAIFWLCFSLIITSSLIFFFHIEISEIQILALVIGMFVSIPASISITKFYLNAGTRQRPVVRTDESRVHSTGLPLSGTFTSPDFGLPEGFVIQYRHAEKSPRIVLHFNLRQQVDGFTIDFGNGKIGIQGHSSSIRDCDGTLCVKVTGPGGNSQSVGW